MQYHFISDNYFFLQGVRDVKLPLKGNISLHKVNLLLRNFRVRYGDIVVIYLTNISLRKKVLRLPEIASSRVIILKSRKDTASISGFISFPWCVAGNVNKETLGKILELATNTPHIRQAVTEQERLLFHYLGHGYNFHWLEKKMHLTRKYLYALKLNTMKKYGLTDGHPARVLLCRDITNMSGLPTDVYFHIGHRLS